MSPKHYHSQVKQTEKKSFLKSKKKTHSIDYISTGYLRSLLIGLDGWLFRQTTLSCMNKKMFFFKFPFKYFHI